MQAGYDLRPSGPIPVCRVWLDAWRDVLHILDKAGMRSIKEFDGRFGGTQSLNNWIQDLECELLAAGAKDPRFLTARVAVCEEGLRRFRSADALMTENWRRALAESYFELGEPEKAEALYRSWLHLDPCWGWGWIGWSDCYRFTRTKRRDWSRCEQILRQGIAIADVRDRADIADRLADACETQGRGEEAAEFRRQATRRPEAHETSRSVSSAGKVLPQRTQVNGEKVGRNHRCPCGSGKKFKKCCGA